MQPDEGRERRRPVFERRKARGRPAPGRRARGRPAAPFGGSIAVLLLAAGCTFFSAQPPGTEPPLDHPFDRDGVLAVVHAYQAAHPDAIGGVFLDEGGIVTVLLVGDAAAHEAAIRAELAPNATIAFRLGRWSEADLTQLQDTIGSEVAWFPSIGAVFESASVDPRQNIVVVTISSADRGAPARVIDHFNGQGRMRVESDGTGVMLRPMGRLSGRVVDKSGKPIAGAEVEYEPLFQMAAIAGVGHVTGPDGRFDIGQVPPGRWRVSVWADGAVIASAEVVVASGGKATVDIVMDRPLPTR